MPGDPDLGGLPGPGPGSLRVVAYLRVSTEEQRTGGISLDAQFVRARDYCALHAYQLVEALSVGESGKSLDRPGLRSALATLVAGTADAFLVVKLDRLTRSVVDLGTLIEGYFGPDHPWRLLSVNDQIDTATSSGRLVLNVLTSVAQWEREATVERTQEVLTYKRGRGERVGGIPYGWHLAGDHVHLEVDAPEALVIQTIRELAAKGDGVRRIVTALNRWGIPSRTGAWHPTTVARILARTPTTPAGSGGPGPEVG